MNIFVLEDDFTQQARIETTLTGWAPLKTSQKTYKMR